MDKYECCPNCGHKPSPQFVIDSPWMKIYECDECVTEYCYQCAANESCPNCGCSERSVVGECYSD